jgi:hypothetical protein
MYHCESFWSRVDKKLKSKFLSYANLKADNPWQGSGALNHISHSFSSLRLNTIDTWSFHPFRSQNHKLEMKTYLCLIAVSFPSSNKYQPHYYSVPQSHPLLDTIRAHGPQKRCLPLLGALPRVDAQSIAETGCGRNR